jgi:hypothetical protein
LIGRHLRRTFVVAALAVGGVAATTTAAHATVGCNPYYHDQAAYWLGQSYAETAQGVYYQRIGQYDLASDAFDLASVANDWAVGYMQMYEDSCFNAEEP